MLPRGLSRNIVAISLATIKLLASMTLNPETDTNQTLEILKYLYMISHFLFGVGLFSAENPAPLVMMVLAVSLNGQCLKHMGFMFFLHMHSNLMTGAEE